MFECKLISGRVKLTQSLVNLSRRDQILRRWEFDNDIFEDLDLDLQVKPVMIRIFETFCKRKSSYLQRRNRNAWIKSASR
jgi:hypothetical protein